VPRPHSLAVLAAALLLPSVAFAQNRFDDPSDDWQFRTSLYAFVPKVGGNVQLPSGAERPLYVSADELISHTDAAGMATFEFRKGRWGAFGDLVAMDLGQRVNGTRSVLAGRMPLPPGTYANASLDIEAFAFTVAGTYRALERDNANIDVFAGGRLLDATVKLDWDFNSDVVGTLRTGSSEIGHASWDGIVGAKGRVYFGERKQWFVPWYVDAGTGASDLTWNASAGLGYAMRWGEVFVTYRRLDYDFGDGRHIADLDFEGPTLGVAIDW
jgi:hypothetical protein